MVKLYKEENTFMILILIILVVFVVFLGYAIYEGHRYRQTCKTLPGYYTEAELVDIRPPKHFIGTYVDIGTSERKAYRSKHCNGWRKLKIGMRFKYYVRREQCEDGRFEESNQSLYEVLCGD
jgi:hypothetical protein